MKKVGKVLTVLVFLGFMAACSESDLIAPSNEIPIQTSDPGDGDDDCPNGTQQGGGCAS